MEDYNKVKTVTDKVSKSLKKSDLHYILVVSDGASTTGSMNGDPFTIARAGASLGLENKILADIMHNTSQYIIQLTMDDNDDQG